MSEPLASTTAGKITKTTAEDEWLHEGKRINLSQNACATISVYIFYMARTAIALILAVVGRPPGRVYQVYNTGTKSPPPPSRLAISGHSIKEAVLRGRGLAL